MSRGDEHIYQYRKGAGWVLAPVVRTLEHVINGARYRLEARVPEVGECCIAAYNRAFSPGWFEPDGSIKLERVIAFLGQFVRPLNGTTVVDSDYVNYHKTRASLYEEEPAWCVVTAL